MCLERFYAKSSLWLANLPYPRLWFFQKKLEKEWKQSWNYQAPLPDGDAMEFFPYTVVVEGIDLKIHWHAKSYVYPRKRMMMDPINIIAYGATAEEFLNILMRSKRKWKVLVGSVHFLHTHSGWKPSIAGQVRLEKPGERYHIRLFSGVSVKGVPLAFCAAHHDPPYDKNGRHITTASWTEVRDLIARDLAAYSQRLNEECVTIPDFRGAEGDGKIRVFIIKEGVV